MKSQIKTCVVSKMIARRAFGNRPISLQTLLHLGFKPHERGSVKDAVDDLIDEGTIIVINKPKKLLILDIKRLSTYT